MIEIMALVGLTWLVLVGVLISYGLEYNKGDE